jgi:hypothetical protein
MRYNEHNEKPCFRDFVNIVWFDGLPVRRQVHEWGFNEVKPDYLHRFHCRKFQNQHHLRRLGTRWF